MELKVGDEVWYKSKLHSIVFIYQNTSQLEIKENDFTYKLVKMSEVEKREESDTASHP